MPELPQPETPGQARIREKLAHLSPADKQKALELIKQMAQKQELERQGFGKGSLPEMPNNPSQ